MSAASTDDGEKVKKVLPPPAPAGRSSSGPYVFLRQRSLATRVIALTTVAVGLSVTVVALAAFFTVRAQTMSTLTDSLLDRAYAAAQGQTLEGLSTQVPSWMLGAADVKIQFLRTDTNPPQVRSVDTTEPIGIGAPEIAVANGTAKYSTRTVTAQGRRWRVAAVPSGTGQALVLAQSLKSTDRMLSRLGLVGQCSITELAGLLGLELSTVSRRVKALEDRGLVERRVSPTDRRTALLSLTPEGRELFERLSASWRDMLAEVLEGWDPFTVEVFSELFARFAAALDAYAVATTGPRMIDTPPVATAKSIAAFSLAASKPSCASAWVAHASPGGGR